MSGLPTEVFETMTLTGGIGLAITCVAIALLPVLLPRGERRTMRMPLIFLGAYLAILAVRVFTRPTEGTDQTLQVISTFCLLSAMARATFLVGLRALMARRLGGAEVPRILRDLVQATLFIGVGLATLRAGGVEPGSLLTTSALLTAVVGLSLQDTLGNLFAGLAIQAQQPFRVGDWIMFDEHDPNAGRVVEMNWRAVRLMTVDQVEIIVPNSTLAKSALQNFSRPNHVARRHVIIEAPYSRSPTELAPLLVQAARAVPGVLDEPAPSAIVQDFTERGVRYDLRFFIDDFQEREIIAASIRTRVWYALQRAGVELSVPQRVVRMFDYTEERIEHEAAAAVDDRDEALHQVDFLRALPDAARHQLAEGTATALYAPGEYIIRAGAEGEELFIIRRGQVAVIGPGGRELARLGRGQFFGEMSLMTGEQRKASVRAIGEVEALLIGRNALRPVLEAQPELAERISRVLTERSAALDCSTVAEDDPGAPETDATPNVLLGRIKRFFSLGADE